MWFEVVNGEWSFLGTVSFVGLTEDGVTQVQVGERLWNVLPVKDFSGERGRYAYDGIGDDSWFALVASN